MFANDLYCVGCRGVKLYSLPVSRNSSLVIAKNYNENSKHDTELNTCTVLQDKKCLLYLKLAAVTVVNRMT